MDNYIKVAQAIIKEARRQALVRQLIKMSESTGPGSRNDNSKKDSTKKSRSSKDDELANKPLIPKGPIDYILRFLNWGDDWDPNVSQKKSRAQYMKTHPDE